MAAMSHNFPFLPRPPEPCFLGSCYGRRPRSPSQVAGRSPRLQVTPDYFLLVPQSPIILPLPVCSKGAG